jgi:hypothetical protein
VLAEVSEVGVDEARRRVGEHYLAAVRRGADARGTMDVDTNIALIGEERGSRVQAHTNPQLPAGERCLALLRCHHSTGGCREGIEESVSLRIDLHSAVALEGFPEQPSVLK